MGPSGVLSCLGNASPFGKPVYPLPLPVPHGGRGVGGHALAVHSHLPLPQHHAGLPLGSAALCAGLCAGVYRLRRPDPAHCRLRDQLSGDVRCAVWLLDRCEQVCTAFAHQPRHRLWDICPGGGVGHLCWMLLGPRGCADVGPPDAHERVDGAPGGRRVRGAGGGLQPQLDV